MSDLIERQAAIKALEELISARNKWISDARNETQGLFVAICAIVDVPRAKPAADISEQLENAYAHGYTAAEAEFRKVMEAERWIPVSEKLPKNNTEVLATICNTKLHTVHGKPFVFQAVLLKVSYGWAIDCELLPDYCEVIAWRPLPEPYKEEKNK